PFWSNFDYARNQAPGATGDLVNNKVWNQLNANEDIRIVQHGEPGAINHFTALQIANSMFTGPNTIPANSVFGKVIFQSCFSDTPVVGGNSLVSDMQTQLTANNYPGVTVTGKNGVAFNFKGMADETGKIEQTPYVWTNGNAFTIWNNFYGGAVGNQATMGNSKGLKAYFDAMYEYRNDTTPAPANNNIFIAPFNFNTPWGLLGITQPAWNLLPVNNRGTQIADAMEPYWENVREFMKDKDALEGLSTLTKVLIGLGVITIVGGLSLLGYMKYK
ncbi:hypothetical protein VT98_11041, partial [Candidatus Electrothrix communis]